MLAALETVATLPEPALARDSAQPPDASKKPDHRVVRLDVPDAWELWVFHAVIPEAQATEIMPIPSVFQSK
ncbi:hypothetical protein GGH95_003865 [Coemansia sp. RSA 1836]|nr:hypothetical protein GGH95_003865 [Coemansia sp. RSA 1836]